MADQNEQYLRKCSLLLVAGEKALDLSEMHIRFETKQEDEESPNNARIRVYNLSRETVSAIQGEYSRVVLQAGYESSSFGVIFDGSIKQFRVGREDNKNTYLDILACDGDLAYNFATVNKSLAAGSTPQQRVAALIDAMKEKGLAKGEVIIPGTGGTLPRGKVLFGLARAGLRAQVQNFGATWSIQNGKINIVPLDEYLPGEAVVLTARTGLIGRPEQTQQGVYARCLINPRINVGGLVKIDNASINQTIQQKDFVFPGIQLPYNQRAGVQMLADISTDGIYRVYVAEFTGDTRGLPWWQDLVLLAVDPSTNKVKPYG
jgi:hypothetical protein